MLHEKSIIQKSYQLHYTIFRNSPSGKNIEYGRQKLDLLTLCASLARIRLTTLGIHRMNEMQNQEIMKIPFPQWLYKSTDLVENHH